LFVERPSSANPSALRQPGSGRCSTQDA